MSGEPRGWLKTSAIGCGILACLPVLAISVVTVRTCAPLFSANQARDRIEERFGPQASFTPAADGSVPGERIDRFLQVRSSLADTCARFEELRAPMQELDDLDRDREPTPREVSDATVGLVGVAKRLTPLVGEFFESRNRALLEAEMGLGEYTYTYALAYRSQLLDRAVRAEMLSSGGPISPEAASALRSMLSKQLELQPSRELESEIRALQRDPSHVPWARGLQAAADRSLEPYRARLDAAFCSPTAGIEMDRDASRALRIALY